MEKSKSTNTNKNNEKKKMKNGFNNQEKKQTDRQRASSGVKESGLQLDQSSSCCRVLESNVLVIHLLSPLKRNNKEEKKT